MAVDLYKCPYVPNFTRYPGHTGDYMKRLKGISFPTDYGRLRSPKIQDLPLPGRVVLPLVSKYGKMTPLVSSGDRVQAGQIVGKGAEKWLPPLLASVTGRVSEITSSPTCFGDEGPALVIEIEEKNIPPRGTDVLKDSPDELARRIQAGGIREVDPAPLPVAIRLRKPELVPSALGPVARELEEPIRCLIINGIDRQPGVWLRKALIRLYGTELLEGISILKETTGASRVLFAVSREDVLAEDFTKGLRELAADPVFCPNTYPIALEPVLVPLLTGREIPPNPGGSRAFGTVVIDVATALRVRDAARDEVSRLDTVVQVTAPSSGIDTLVRVREGTLIEDILENLSLAEMKPAKVLCGGPFLGIALYRLDVPVTQETDSIILQTEKEITRYSDEPCMDCGYCVRHCPMRLLPNELSKNCEYGRFNAAERLDLFFCIECGICAYVCPVNRPMVQLMRFGKQEIEAGRRES